LKQHPDGVDPELFNNKEYKGIDMTNPVAVEVVMEGSNAILYDIRAHQYKLMSQAYVVALRNYDRPNA
jgi:hypothetical protein